ncbi:hypothetical protein D9611_014617 [Ephemerocybe angulata]|uniref:DRBM domain-containing protein n=1 Tax=Ephemerocybe angulata TaxID=980116 RepID=A0A8H5CAR1_9AGAR|nr:hypothetical protein D9611_014617 [Tulosesus angulatus]
MLFGSPRVVPITALHNCEQPLEAPTRYDVLIDHKDLAKRGELDSLSYSELGSGPQNDPTWTIECKIGSPIHGHNIVNGTVRGTGVAKKKKAAEQAAAKQALELLYLYSMVVYDVS